MTQKLLIKKEGPILEIFNPKLNRSVRYDLKTKVMEKQTDSGKWVIVKQQYEFFHGYDISDIETGDKKFIQLIELTAKLNPGCKSVSSFIVRMKEALIYENYINEGIEADAYARINSDGYISRTLLTEPLEFYSKPIIIFFKTFHIAVSNRIEEVFKESYKQYEQLVQNIMDSQIPNDKKAEVFSSLISYRNIEFFTLVKDYKYDMKALFGYLFNYLEPFEGVTWDEGVRTLCDYYRMASLIGRNVKKYPKYLNSMHDIITANYNSYKKEYDEKRFGSLQKPEMLYEGKKYCVVIPVTSKDIVSEGTDLNHCVSSYVDKILNKECYIMFLRLKDKKTESLITLELKNETITQAKGSYNRKLEKGELEFLQEYCKKKKLDLKI